MTAGARPKLTRSASESNCVPNSLSAPSQRAAAAVQHVEYHREENSADGEFPLMHQGQRNGARAGAEAQQA